MMDDTVTSNDDVEQLGYPTDILRGLVSMSEERYRDKVEFHGPGKNWLDDESRWHIWKACDEMFQARDDAHRNQFYSARLHMADALNHMLFALEITKRRRDLDPETHREADR